MMNKLKSKVAGLFAGLGVAFAASVAMATPTFEITPPDIDYVSLGTYASSILAALAAVWIIRKFVKLTNRS